MPQIAARVNSRNCGSGTIWAMKRTNQPTPEKPAKMPEIIEAFVSTENRLNELRHKIWVTGHAYNLLPKLLQAEVSNVQPIGIEHLKWHGVKFEGVMSGQELEETIRSYNECLGDHQKLKRRLFEETGMVVHPLPPLSD